MRSRLGEKEAIQNSPLFVAGGCLYIDGVKARVYLPEDKNEFKFIF